jgi:hypothetical protein
MCDIAILYYNCAMIYESNKLFFVLTLGTVLVLLRLESLLKQNNATKIKCLQLSQKKNIV